MAIIQSFQNQTISMYKSKLQQLCQQNYWPLPEYSCIKQAPDHHPAFKASVFVNGLSFHSASPCKSSKEAQNDAAMRAFFHLSLQSDAEAVEDEPVRAVLNDKVADQSLDVLGNVLTANGKEASDVAFLPVVRDTGINVQIPYKLQLQTYVQRNHLSLPSYSVTSIGPPHNSHFVACVTAGEQEFKGLSFSKTAKEAENDAAKAALTSLSPDGLEQIFPGYVKNLLQELVQKEGLSLPVYKTSFSGPAHMQLFFSVVEVGDEVFKGKAAKSKKLSELHAAEVAFRSLEQRRLNRTCLSKPHAPEAKTPETKNCSDLKNDIREPSVNINTCVLQASNGSKLKKYEVGVLNPVKKLQTNGQLITNGNTKTDATSKKAGEVSAGDSGSSQSCYIFRNKVRVYTIIPDIEFPEGIFLIPIGDNKWVPVSLEFSNEKGI